MFKILANLFLFILIYQTSLTSKELVVNGLNKLTLADIQAITSVDISSNSLDDSDINEFVKELYLSEQIFNLSYISDDKSYIINLEEAPVIENIFINGNLNINDDVIIASLNSKKNYLLNKKVLDEDISLLKNLYLSKGYENLSVTVTTEKFSDTKINLIYSLDEGSISKISYIKFIGNDSFSTKYLLSIINTSPISDFNIFSKGSNLNKAILINDIEKLKEFYRNKGFNNIDISFKIEKKFLNQYIINFYIDENERIKISSINFNDIDSLINNFNPIALDFEKEISKNEYYYDYEIIDAQVRKLNLELDKLNIKKYVNFEVNFIDKKYNLNFYTVPSSNLLVNQISTSGNTITKSDVLLSKITFAPGDYINEQDLNSSRKSLQNLKYINKVDYKASENNDNSVDVNFEIDENKKTGNILLGGSISGDVGLGLIFTLKDYNVFGSGNEINANINSNSEQTQFDISYTSYSFNNPNISNTYSIKNIDTDFTSSYGYKLMEKSLSYTLTTKISENIKTNYGITLSNNKGYSPKFPNEASISESIDNFNDTILFFSIDQDKTNDFLYPSNGYSNKFIIQISPDEISDNAYVSTKYNGDIYYDFKETDSYIFLSNRIGIAEAINGKLKTNNTFSLGGLNFKGFDYRGIGSRTANNVIVGGNKYFTSTIGYGSSFLFDSKDNVYFRIFYTTGSLWDSDYINEDFKLRSSVGTSMDILTPVGPISFSYSVPLQKTSTDRERRFNFTIGTAF